MTLSDRHEAVLSVPERVQPPAREEKARLTLYLQQCQTQADRCDYCGRLAKRVRGVALCGSCVL